MILTQKKYLMTYFFRVMALLGTSGGHMATLIGKFDFKHGVSY